ncbi:MAG: hypothetical protein OEV41_04340 [Gammaproteobacteria bacterium]|nr:hypothetical protein [Gammaproteobacteria bacterium]
MPWTVVTAAVSALTPMHSAFLAAFFAHLGALLFRHRFMPLAGFRPALFVLRPHRCPLLLGHVPHRFATLVHRLAARRAIDIASVLRLSVLGEDCRTKEQRSSGNRQ